MTTIYHKQSVALLDNALQVSNFSNRFAGFDSGQAIQLHALLLRTCKLFGRGGTTVLLLQYCFSKPLQHIISFAIMLRALHYGSTCFLLITPGPGEGKSQIYTPGADSLIYPPKEKKVTLLFSFKLCVRAEYIQQRKHPCHQLGQNLGLTASYPLQRT